MFDITDFIKDVIWCLFVNTLESQIVIAGLFVYVSRLQSKSNVIKTQQHSVDEAGYLSFGVLNYNSLSKI